MATPQEHAVLIVAHQHTMERLSERLQCIHENEQLHFRRFPAKLRPLYIHVQSYLVNQIEIHVL